MSRLKAVPVPVLYACESGSRAWGFASADSDYDVRFLYVREPDHYFSIDVEHRSDVLEFAIAPMEDGTLLDMGGWDLRKALKLMCRCNGALLEWLHSPIVYLDRCGETLRELAVQSLNPRALGFHYLGMARNRSERRATAKDYFYLLRPLLAVGWLEGGRGVIPVPFDELLAVLPDELRVRVQALRELK
ncbi:MAG: nucleotidyltransferase domain-containing protein, partial [Candidatus Eremiobacterota bacterium]